MLQATLKIKHNTLKYCGRVTTFFLLFKQSEIQRKNSALCRDAPELGSGQNSDFDLFRFPAEKCLPELCATIIITII